MIFSDIYKKRYFSWSEIAANIENLDTKKAKGDAFEQFAFAFFTYFRDLYQIKYLYMGVDIPQE